MARLVMNISILTVLLYSICVSQPHKPDQDDHDPTTTEMDSATTSSTRQRPPHRSSTTDTISTTDVAQEIVNHAPIVSAVVGLILIFLICACILCLCRRQRRRRKFGKKYREALLADEVRPSQVMVQLEQNDEVMTAIPSAPRESIVVPNAPSMDEGTEMVEGNGTVQFQ